jgi:putative FmdB family regulatory protein
MPTYEYECDKCGHKFEEFQSITAEPLKKCPKCKGHIRRLIGTGAGLIFRGSGFYTTDYRKKDYKKKESEESKNRENKSKSSKDSVCSTCSSKDCSPCSK